MAKRGHATKADLPRPLLPGHGRWVELYYAAWDLAREHIVHHPGLPAPYYMDEACLPDRVWQWDSCFMALFCRYAHDLYPGIESLDNFYAVQRDDGYISMCHLVETGEDAYPLPPTGRINPPLLSWAELEHYRVTGDEARLRRVLGHLVRYDRWIEANRRRADGSYWFADCGSAGMDNSPRTPRTDHRGGETAFVDLAAQQALSALCISRLARAAGDLDLAASYDEAHRQRVEFLNARHWNSRHGIYYDRHLDGNFINRKTVAAFWPMLAGAASPAKFTALVERLEHPEEFNRPNPVPSLSHDDCDYRDDGGYWLGGVWAPTNYMVVRGLLRHNAYRLARAITARYLDVLDRVRRDREPHTLWECYSPETDAPGVTGEGDLCRPDFVGWTGIGPIAMLIEVILGLDVDYPHRTITWRSDILEEHGIENLRFGPYRVDLRAASRKSLTETPRIEVHSPVPVKVAFIAEDPTEGVGT